MAYDVNKRRQVDEEENPYDAMVAPRGLTKNISDFQAWTPSSQQTPGPQGPPQMMEASGPTTTGYVNFGQMYNANAGVAQREAGKRTGAADAAGQKAIQGRTGAVQDFSNAARAGTNYGPTNVELDFGGGARPFSDDSSPRNRSKLSVEDYRAGLAAGGKRGYEGPDALAAQDDYDKLLADATAAQDLAANPLTGLGETDRALLGAAGRPQVDELAGKYNNLTKQLEDANAASIGEADAARGQSKKGQDVYDQLLSEFDGRRQREKEAGGEIKDTEKPAPWRPDGYDDLNSFLHPDVNDFSDANQYGHQAGLTLSPADWLTRGLGELGYGGQNATEIFAGNFSGGGFKNDWWAANMRTAVQQVANEYGQEAVQEFWDRLTPEMWAEYQKMGNSGRIAKELRAWLESAGHKKNSAPRPKTSELSNNDTEGSTHSGPDGTEYKTTPEQEESRQWAYKQGWLDEWEKQFRAGNQNPQRP